MGRTSSKTRLGLSDSPAGLFLRSFGETILESEQKSQAGLFIVWCAQKNRVWSSFGNDPLHQNMIFENTWEQQQRQQDGETGETTTRRFERVFNQGQTTCCCYIIYMKQRVCLLL